MSDVKNQIRTFISDNFLLGAAEPFGDTTSLLEMVDSTGFLELVNFLETTFAIKVADEEMVPENLETVDNMVQFLARKRAG